jgi:hypothetical protein
METHHRKAQLFTAIDALKNAPELLIDYLNDKGIHKFTYLRKHDLLFKNIENFELNGNYCIFELMRSGCNRKPYLDIEFNYPNKKAHDKDVKRILNFVINNTIEIFKTQYNEQLKRKDIKILRSSGEVNDGYKMSYHIIVSPENRTLYYTSSRQSNSSAYHYFALLLAKDKSYEEWLDSSVYNLEPTLRIIGSAKTHSDLRILKPIDVNTLEEIDVSDEQKLHYMLSHIKKERKMLATPIFEQTIKPKQTFSANNPPTTIVRDDILKMVKKHHPSAVHAKLYNGIYHRFSYSDRTEKCPISGEVHDGTNDCFVVENDRGYYLKCFSAKCKGSLHIGYTDMSNEVIDNGIQLNRQYMIMKDKFEDDVAGRNIMRWMQFYKLLVVKSAMGTGKTTMIEKIIYRYDGLEKILWITHRQTLTRQIFGKFKKYGFANYIDEKGSLFDHPKIIVQIDSLFRIATYDDDHQLNINAYDLVIIDEIEGNLNHYSSPFLNKNIETNRSTFDFMVTCLRNAKKVLLLDADVGSRTSSLVSHMGQAIVINNNYKPPQKTFAITNDPGRFDKSILDDVGEGKNICIVSMTAGYIDKMAYELETMGIKYIAHTSRTDDKLKIRLENVNDLWKDYQVVLYSPCIESGVDFNLKHFDKIYAVLKNGNRTCSQRAFLQMIGRIRVLNDYTIKCLYKAPINIDSPMYTYNDVLGYLKYYETINGKKIIKDLEFEEICDGSVVKLVRKTGNVSLFDEISIHNEVEQLNRASAVFMTVMNKLLQISDHKLEFNIVENPLPSKIGNDVMSVKDKIIAVDDKNHDINTLMTAQAQCNANETQKLALRKKFIIKFFRIKHTQHKELLDCFLKKFIDSEILCRRFEDFFGYKKISEDDYEYDDLSVAMKKMRNSILVDLLNLLLGKNNKSYVPDYLVAQTEEDGETNNSGIKIGGPEYDERLTKIAKESKYFMKEEESRALFFFPKGKHQLFNNESKQHYTNTIQTILRVYGIKFKASGRIQRKGKRYYTYLLSVNEQIRNIMDLKYGLPTDEGEYDKLFKNT